MLFIRKQELFSSEIEEDCSSDIDIGKLSDCKRNCLSNEEDKIWRIRVYYGMH